LSDAEPDQDIIERLLPGRQDGEQGCAALLDVEPGFNQPSHQVKRGKTSACRGDIPVADQRLIHGLDSQGQQA
jgi:hypothetical protein